MDTVNKEALRLFLIDSNQAGYASGNAEKWRRESDGSTTILLEKGSWQYHDNYFSGEPYGGRTIVSYAGRPVWMLVYYGWLSRKRADTKAVYGILRKALLLMPEEHPFRGPREYKEDKFIYTNSWEGELERFSGEEHIACNNELIYTANYAGGYVNQRGGL